MHAYCLIAKLAYLVIRIEVVEIIAMSPWTLVAAPPFPVWAQPWMLLEGHQPFLLPSSFSFLQPGCKHSVTVLLYQISNGILVNGATSHLLYSMKTWSQYTTYVLYTVTIYYLCIISASLFFYILLISTVLLFFNIFFIWPRNIADHTPHWSVQS